MLIVVLYDTLKAHSRAWGKCLGVGARDGRSLLRSLVRRENERLLTCLVILLNICSSLLRSSIPFDYVHNVDDRKGICRVFMNESTLWRWKPLQADPRMLGVDSPLAKRDIPLQHFMCGQNDSHARQIHLTDRSTWIGRLTSQAPGMGMSALSCSPTP